MIFFQITSTSGKFDSKLIRLLYNTSNTMGATCEQDLITLPETHEIAPVFGGVSVALSLVFYVMSYYLSVCLFLC